MKRIILITLLMSPLLHTAFSQTVIDVHSHIIPQSYVGVLTQHGALQEEGFPLPKWDVENQLRWMDDAGVETSVLTLAAPQPCFGDANESRSEERRVGKECRSRWSPYH